MTQIEARWANRKVPWQGMARRDAAQALEHAAIKRREVAIAKEWRSTPKRQQALHAHGQCLDAARRARARAAGFAP